MKHAFFRWTLFALLGLASPWDAKTTLKSEHEPLRVRNTFQKPEDVVRYYCSRDASGFVWSGLLEIERRAFTFWNQVPEQDTMFVARSFRLGKVRLALQEAWIDVEYDLLGVADIHGTFQPSGKPPVRKVTFHLRKKDSTWRIVTPDASEITPVVVDRLFPVLRAAS